MSITASDARARLFALIEQVNDDQVPVEISSRRGTAVLLSADEFHALEETAYLLRSPKNARRLMRSRQEADAGHTLRRDLDLA